MKRYQRPAFEQLRTQLDPDLLLGTDIALIGLEPRLFDASPAVHYGPTERRLRAFYAYLQSRARRDNRLDSDCGLLVRTVLLYDMFSPKLGCFIEIDERQHFSTPRLARLRRIGKCHPECRYPSYFWQYVLPTLRAARDLSPPHRDEQRAFLDIAREILPLVYGLGATLRLDEFTLRRSNRQPSQLVTEMLNR